MSLGAVAVVLAAAVLARPVLGVAAVIVKVAVIVAACVIGSALVAVAVVVSVRLWRWALAHWPEREAINHTVIPAALPAPPLALEGRVVGVALTPERVRVER